MRLRQCRPTVAFLAIISVSACTAWQPYMPRSGVEPPTKVRVHLTTGETVTLLSPVMEGDSALVGHVESTDSLGTVPLRLVRDLEQGKVSLVRTVGVIVLVPIAGVLALVAWCDITDCLDT